MPAVADPILSVRDIYKSFGGLMALNGPRFEVARGSITGLIGPNGSGKTTLFNVITGLLKPDRGEVRFDDRTITGLRPYQISRQGIGRTFQITRLFGRMTVLENLRVVSRSRDSGLQQIQELLDMVNLWELRHEEAANLSYGQSKLLEFARVLMLEPRLVTLDEPFAGINPTMKLTLLQAIEELHGRGVTFLIIDHEMAVIMELCQRVLVLDYGNLIADDLPHIVQQDERVIDAYFGTSRGDTNG
jgi:ABC-type branched-subunit amino acid transport system ATPase component